MSKVPSDFGEWSEATKLHFNENMRSNTENSKKFGKFEKIWKIRKNLKNRNVKFKIIHFEKNSEKFEKN